MLLPCRIEHICGVLKRNTLDLRTLAMTSGSGSATGSAHSTVTGFPHTLTLPLIRRRRACAADLWSSYSRKQKPRFFFLSSGWWYNITSWRPSVKTNQNIFKFQNSCHVYHPQRLMICFSTFLTQILFVCIGN